MIDLDDNKTYEKFDPQGMVTHINSIPNFCEVAWLKANSLSLPEDYININKIVILGMGGSAIGGDLLSNFVLGEAKIPIFLQRDYTLPAFVDRNTLVIASSCSGSTEETLASFDETLKTKAKKLVITSGGQLKTLAIEKKIPVIDYENIAPPRALLPFSLLPLLGVLHKLDIISNKSADITEAIFTARELLKSINTDSPLGDNQAKQLAISLYEHLPLIYGAEILSQVAHRWKTQLNENSKAWAFYDNFPELNHNAVSGFNFPEYLIPKIVVVMLRSTYLSQRIQMRYKLTAKLLDNTRIKYHFIDGIGKTPLSHMISTIIIGDYTSYYLAMLYEADPYPIKNIDYLKQHWQIPLSGL